MKRCWSGAVLGLSITSSSATLAYLPIELTPHVGYQAGGGAESASSRTEISGGLTLGMSVEYAFLRSYLARFTYQRLSSTLVEVDAGIQTQVPLAVGYLQAGAEHQWFFGKLFPFVSLSAGASHFTPSSDALDTEWAFAFGGQAGVKLAILTGVALRFHGQLLLSAPPSDSQLFCAPGEACSFTWGPLLPQGDVGAGLLLLF